MSKYKHVSSLSGYYHICDGCHEDDGRQTLNWFDKDFAICFKCLKELAVKYIFPEYKKVESLITKRKSISEHIRNKVLKRDKRSCQACGSKNKLTIDHIIPFIFGGKTQEDNLQVLCKSCNSSKGCKQ